MSIDLGILFALSFVLSLFIFVICTYLNDLHNIKWLYKPSVLFSMMSLPIIIVFIWTGIACSFPKTYEQEIIVKVFEADDIQFIYTKDIDTSKYFNPFNMDLNLINLNKHCGKMYKNGQKLKVKIPTKSYCGIAFNEGRFKFEIEELGE